MKVQLHLSLAGNDGCYRAGQIIDVSDEDGQILVERGTASRVDGTPPAVPDAPAPAAPVEVAPAAPSGEAPPAGT